MSKMKYISYFRIIPRRRRVVLAPFEPEVVAFIKVQKLKEGPL